MGAWLGSFAAAVPVEVRSSFTLNTALFMAMIALLGGVLRELIKNRPVLRKLKNEEDANLLTERAGDMASMREEIKEMKAEFARKDKENRDEQKRREAIYDAKEALSRHRANNITNAFNSLLMLLKKKVPVEEAVETIEAMRALHLEAEAKEAAAIHAAMIAAGHQVTIEELSK